jgi:hypothetical protein
MALLLDSSGLLWFWSGKKFHPSSEKLDYVSIGSDKEVWGIKHTASSDSSSSSSSSSSSVEHPLGHVHSPSLFSWCRTGLNVEISTEFEKIWDDRQTTAEPYRVGFWRPIAPEGYFILGDFCERSHLAFPRSGAVLVVKEANSLPQPTRQSNSAGTPLLVPPVKFELVWSNKGLRGKYGPCSIWRPVPLSGYIALGYVANQSYDQPPNAEQIRYRCVHSSLLRMGVFHPHHSLEQGGGYPNGDLDCLWRDKKSGSKKKCSIWPVYTPTDVRGAFSPGTFVAVDHYEPPFSRPYILNCFF